MTKVDTAIREFMREIQGVEGIRHAPEEPPEQMSSFPFAVGYANRGAFKIGPPELMTGLHDVVIELHVARDDELSTAFVRAMSFASSIPNALFLALKNSSFTVAQTFGEIEYTFGPLGWGDIETLGFTFFIRQVKIQETIE